MPREPITIIESTDGEREWISAVGYDLAGTGISRAVESDFVRKIFSTDELKYPFWAVEYFAPALVASRGRFEYFDEKGLEAVLRGMTVMENPPEDGEFCAVYRFDTDFSGHPDVPGGDYMGQLPHEHVDYDTLRRLFEDRSLTVIGEGAILCGPIKPEISAHRFCDDNRESLRSGRAGCFHCCGVFLASEIREWIDADETALCPRCGIDSVLSENDVALDAEFLRLMNKTWF